jgi:hypothetical protein
MDRQRDWLDVSNLQCSLGRSTATARRLNLEPVRRSQLLAEEQPNLFGLLLAEAHFLAVASTEKRSLTPSVDSNPCLNASTG